MLSDRDRVVNFLQDYDLHGTAAYIDKFADLLKQAREAEREACAKFVEATYLQDDDHEEALRARFVVPESTTGYLEAWHQPRDVAEAIRNRDSL